MPSLCTLPAALVAVLMAAASVMAEPVTIQLKNGDTIHAELMPKESNDSITVVIHPQLGRLEISSEAISQRRSHPPGLPLFPPASLHSGKTATTA